MSFDGITLKFSDSTKSKIAAYAVLSRQPVDTVMSQIEGMVDEALKDKCIELLGGVAVYEHSGGGVSAAQTLIPMTEPADKTMASAPQVTKKKSFADAHKKAAAAAPVEEEAFSSIEGGEHVPQHELSADEDPQENKSLEEQVEEDEPLDPDEEQEFKETFSSARFKDAGKNAEAFLDNAMGEPDEEDTDEIPTVTAGYAGRGPYGEKPIKATKSFESRLRKGHRARISAHTGDED